MRSCRLEALSIVHHTYSKSAWRWPCSLAKTCSWII